MTQQQEPSERAKDYECTFNLFMFEHKLNVKKEEEAARWSS